MYTNVFERLKSYREKSVMSNVIQLVKQILIFPFIVPYEAYNYFRYRKTKLVMKNYKNNNTFQEQNDELYRDYINFAKRDIFNYSKRDWIILLNYAFCDESIINNIDPKKDPLYKILRDVESLKQINYVSIKLYIKNILLCGDDVCKDTDILNNIDTYIDGLIYDIENKLGIEFDRKDVSVKKYRGIGSTEIVSCYRPYVLSYVIKFAHIVFYFMLHSKGFRCYEIGSGLKIWRKNNYDENKKSVVFIHGIGTGLISYNSFIDKLNENFDNVFLVEIPDISGNGVSGYDSSIVNFAVSIKKYLNHINVNKTDLVVHSFGSLIGATFINMYPNMVDKKIFIDSISFFKVLLQVQKRTGLIYPKAVDCIDYIRNIDLVEDSRLDGANSLYERLYFYFISDKIFVKDIWLQFYIKSVMIWYTVYMTDKNINNMHVVLSKYEIYYDPVSQYERMGELGIPCKMYDCHHGGFVLDKNVGPIIQTDVIEILKN